MPPTTAANCEGAGGSRELEERKGEVREKIKKFKGHIKYLEAMDEAGKEIYGDPSEKIVQFKVQLEAAHKELQALKPPEAQKFAAKALVKKRQQAWQSASEALATMEAELEEKEKLRKEQKQRVADLERELETAKLDADSLAEVEEPGRGHGVLSEEAAALISSLPKVKAEFDNKIAACLDPGVAGLFVKFFTAVEVLGKNAGEAWDNVSVASGATEDMAVDVGEELINILAEHTVGPAQEGESEEVREAALKKARINLGQNKQALGRQLGDSMPKPGKTLSKHFSKQGRAK